jgi:aspartyl-tRNA(Asn)/glutamyl-tRNA(Gln) amidotransferase subunit C
MTSLSRDDIENIARLARLALRETEVSVYTDSLSRIIDLVGELNQAQTSGVEPMSHRYRVW